MPAGRCLQAGRDKAALGNQRCGRGGGGGEGVRVSAHFSLLLLCHLHIAINLQLTVTWAAQGGSIFWFGVKWAQARRAVAALGSKGLTSPHAQQTFDLASQFRKEGCRGGEGGCCFICMGIPSLPRGLSRLVGRGWEGGGGGLVDLLTGRPAGSPVSGGDSND